jgi:NADPH2:quinone reductase
MFALHIDRHGPIADLRSCEIPAPPLGSGEVRVAIAAAGVNPSDIASAEGRFPQAILPRTLGRDFAGRVIEGPAPLVGAQVWGSGGDLGITRDGTHAEQVVVPATAIATRPVNLSDEQAGAAALPFLTAWSTLIVAGRVSAGEWVIVSGAAGAVGRAATELAAARQAHVIALVLNEDETKRLDTTKVAAIARSDLNDLADVARQATNGRGAQLALNGVGAPVFQPMFDALAPDGRMVVYSAAGGREVSLNLFNLYRRRVELIGVDTAIFDAETCARILAEITPLFERGAIAPLPVGERYPLTAAAAAYTRVAAGSPGKVVLIPRP